MEKKFKEGHHLGQRENPYHNENRYIRTQQYKKNIIHLNFRNICLKTSFMRKTPPLWHGGEGHQFVSIENSSAQ